MKKIIFWLVFFLSLSSPAFASIECPKLSDELFDQGEIIGKISACLEARKNGTENTITEYTCPNGNQAYEDKTPFNTETLSYMIAGEIMMQKVDEEVKEYALQLRDSRDKSAVAWTENYGKCIHGRGPKDTSVQDIYSQICTPAYIIHFLNANQTPKIINTTGVFPQRICNNRAQKKILAWENMATSLMHDGINKSYQNDKDYYMEENYGQYQSLVDSFHIWQKLVSQSVSKMTAYIRQSN